MLLCGHLLVIRLVRFYRLGITMEDVLYHRTRGRQITRSSAVRIYYPIVRLVCYLARICMRVAPVAHCAKSNSCLA